MTKTEKKATKQLSKATDIARAPEKQQRIEMTEEVIDAILEEIAGGKSLVRVCATPGMPNRTSFLRRVAEDPLLQKRYALAMDVRADVYAEETIDIADDGRNDTYLDDEGNKKTDTDVVARSKLRIAARQWYAAKIAPKRYGEKVDLNHGGQEGNPVQVKTKVVMVPMKQKAETSIRPMERDGD
jgi:hypothetical protein